MISSKPVYGILGVYIPLSVLVLWAPLFDAAYTFFAHAYPGYIPADIKTWYISAFIIAVGASVYASLMKKSMLRHSAADIRGCIIAALAVYLLLSLLRFKTPLAERFFPTPDSVASTLAALLVWFSVISLREIFSGLEFFGSIASQRHDEQLRESMREYAPEIIQTDKKLKNLMVSYGIQFFLPVFLINILGLFRNSPALIIFLVLIFCAGFLLLGFLRILRRELAFAAEGLSLAARDRLLPIPVMALMIVLAAVLAFSTSSDTSLLPPGMILALLLWIKYLLSLLFRPGDAASFAALEDKNMPMPENPGPLLPQTEFTGPWAGWKYVRYGFIALAAILFLFFMVYPLLKRSRFSVKAEKIFAALRRWITDLKKSLLVFFDVMRNQGPGIKLGKPDQAKLRRIASALVPDSIRRRELKHNANLFARLILWGIETAGVAWKPSLAPGEYCVLLAAAYRTVCRNAHRDTNSTESNAAPDMSAATKETIDGGEIGEEIIRSGELFEKALYSPRSLTAGEGKEFASMIQHITTLPKL